MLYEIKGGNIEVTICHENGDVLITFPVDDLWDYITSQGLNEMFEDDFDPASLYGHTQRCWTISREDYLNSDLESEIKTFLNISINLNFPQK